MTTERERFEAWGRNEYGPGWVIVASHRGLWEAWQAALAQPAQPVAKLARAVAVPREPAAWSCGFWAGVDGEPLSPLPSVYSDEQLERGLSALREIREKLGEAASDETICGVVYDAMTFEYRAAPQPAPAAGGCGCSNFEFYIDKPNCSRYPAAPTPSERDVTEQIDLLRESLDAGTLAGCDLRSGYLALGAIRAHIDALRASRATVAEDAALTDEQVAAAVGAWFGGPALTPPYNETDSDFMARMRAAIDAARGKP